MNFVSFKLSIVKQIVIHENELNVFLSLLFFIKPITLCQTHSNIKAYLHCFLFRVSQLCREADKL